MLRHADFIGRSVIQNGPNGAAVRIPSKVRDEVGLEAGREGDLVDMRYDREDRTLTIHFPEK